MEQNSKARLQDIVPYSLDTYFSQDEIDLIRSTFKNNPRLMKLLRKVFIPTIHDPELPIEEISGDVWLAGKDWDAIPVDEVKSLVVARADAVKFVVGGLIKLKVLAHQEDENAEKAALRRKVDSAQ